MTVVGISMFRNELDVAPYVVAHMLAEVDRVLIADNGSDDGTRELLLELARTEPRLEVCDEPRFGYGQAQTMNRLAGAAGAVAWICPFDADEWWYSPAGRIADVLGSLGDEEIATSARMRDLIPLPTDPDIADPFERMTWTRAGTFWSGQTKIAYRPGPGRVLTQGNHSLEGLETPPVGPLRIRHHPFRSFEQARAKLRHGREAILAAGLPEWSGVHWQEWGAYSDERLAAWWDAWTDPRGLVRWTP